MKKIFNLFLYLSVFLSLTSCFELREEIDLKKNGSGTYRMLFDMSKSKEFLDNIKAMNGDNPDSKGLLSEADTALIKGSEAFKDISGISNVKDIQDEQNYIYGIRFDFANIDALNDAVLQMSGNTSGLNEDVYRFEKGHFERKNMFYLNSLTDNLGTGEQTEEQEQFKMFLQTATYAFVLRTEGKIKTSSNEKAELSEKNKQLRQVVPLLELSDKKHDISQKVKLK